MVIQQLPKAAYSNAGRYFQELSNILVIIFILHFFLSVLNLSST